MGRGEEEGKDVRGRNGVRAWWSGLGKEGIVWDGAPRGLSGPA